jgi:hypothetical protein
MRKEETETLLKARAWNPSSRVTHFVHFYRFKIAAMLTQLQEKRENRNR